jgi:hypothetical protein
VVALVLSSIIRADQLKFGVEEVCDSRERGGFGKYVFKDKKDPIEFEVYITKKMVYMPYNL